MIEPELDDIDRNILFLLQEDARNLTNSNISHQVGVSPSTVGNRIREMEENGVIQGYKPVIDYERTGHPFRVLFICSTSIERRPNLVKKAINISGVVNIHELMTGQRNVLIEVVGRENADITSLATAISDLGFVIDEEVLMKDTYPRPASVFME